MSVIYCDGTIAAQPSEAEGWLGKNRKNGAVRKDWLQTLAAQGAPVNTQINLSRSCHPLIKTNSTD